MPLHLTQRNHLSAKEIIAWAYKAPQAAKVPLGRLEKYAPSCQLTLTRLLPYYRRQVIILGMTTSALTLLHVVRSLIGIAAGLIVVVGMFGSKTLDGWAAVFLAATILTSVGFFFPRGQVLPSHLVGVLSLIVLAFAVLALYRYRFVGAWRLIYVVTAVVALYLNVFFGVVQAFQKVPFLHEPAPTQADPPFLIAQLVVLVAFVAIGFLALRSFHWLTWSGAARAMSTRCNGESPAGHPSVRLDTGSLSIRPT